MVPDMSRKINNINKNVLELIHRHLDPPNSARLASTSRTMRETVPSNRWNKVKGKKALKYPSQIPSPWQDVSEIDVKALRERFTLLYTVLKQFHTIPKRHRKTLTRRAFYSTLTNLIHIERRRVSGRTRVYPTIKKSDIHLEYMDKTCHTVYRLKDVSNTVFNDYDSCFLFKMDVRIEWKHRGIPFDVLMYITYDDIDDIKINMLVNNSEWILYVIGNPEFYNNSEISWNRLSGPRQRRFMIDGGILKSKRHYNSKQYSQFQTIALVRLLKVVQKTIHPRPLVFLLWVSDNRHQSQISNMIRTIVQPFPSLVFNRRPTTIGNRMNAGTITNQSNISNRSNRSNTSNNNTSNTSSSNNNSRR